MLTHKLLQNNDSEWRPFYAACLLWKWMLYGKYFMYTWEDTMWEAHIQAIFILL